MGGLLSLLSTNRNSNSGEEALIVIQNPICYNLWSHLIFFQRISSGIYNIKLIIFILGKFIVAILEYVYP